jgi:hypothetical protein
MPAPAVMIPPMGQEEPERAEIVAVGEADLAGMRDRLAEIEAEYAMLAAELAVFQADYTREVVTVLARLHDVEARILALGGDAGAASEARTRARRTTAAAGAVAPPPEPVPPASLKRLFRDAAKRMHPDLAAAGEAREHAEAFMKRLNDAYRAGDAEAIADLLRQWDASPFAAGAADGGAPRVAAVQAAVARAQRRLDELRDSELARMMERTMASAAAGEDHIATLRHHAELALADALARLARH